MREDGYQKYSIANANIKLCWLLVKIVLTIYQYNVKFNFILKLYNLWSSDHKYV